MKDRLRLFSDFVQDLNDGAAKRDAADVLGWSTRELSDILGFDCAWYGWAQICDDGAIIHASSTYNLPDDYFQTWTEISSEDLLAAQFVENPDGVSTYDRSGDVHTDGMQHLSDTYALKKMATAMNLRAGRSASLYISAYRGGDTSHAWSAEDCEFLQCAVDHVAAAARGAAQREMQDLDDEASSVLINEEGVAIVGLNSMRERFGHIWSRQNGDRVPRFLTEYIDLPGEHLLIDQGLVANCERVTGNDGLALQKMTLRPLQKFDLLTARERDVARILASGKSHKETARILGVAPSTVRNQTQSIYGKLEVDNRASLATHVPA
ncbi:MAG: LuxR C-terminal-related transcriptional regulator [Pikeienuella sp.]